MPSDKPTTKPKVFCVMPCASVPVPAAWRALNEAAARYGNVIIDAPDRNPRDVNRNIIVSRFLLRTDADWLLMVDSDTTIPVDAIEKMLSLRKSVVCGVQPLILGASSSLVANVMPYPSADNPDPHWPNWLEWNADAKPHRIRWCGFGCVLMHRAVFGSFDWPWFHEDHGDRFGRNNVTEDVYFCRKAKRANIEVWCHPGVVCGHHKMVDLLDVVPRGMLRIGFEGEPEQYLEIPGWTPQEAEDLFRARASQVQDGATFVEVGVFHGRGLCCMAEWARYYKKRVQIHGIDHFEGSREIPLEYIDDMQTYCRANLSRAGFNGEVQLIDSDSAEGAALFADGSLDFVYVDAGHTEVEAARDIQSWIPKVKPGGVIAGDDFAVEFPGVVRAVNRLLPGAEVRGRVWAMRIGGTQSPWDRPQVEIDAEAEAMSEANAVAQI